MHQRKAVLGFIAELDINELPLFYALLLNPLTTTSHRANVIDEWLQLSPKYSSDDFNSSTILQQFTVDNIRALPMKKVYGFLHVVEDVLGVFDILHIKPFLNLLMGCVVRILTSCSSSLFCTKSGPSQVENESILLDKSDKVSVEIKSMVSCR